MKENRKMTPKQLKTFMMLFGMDKEKLGEVLGVSPGAVYHWLSGIRSIPPTTVKVLKLAEKRPELLQEMRDV